LVGELLTLSRLEAGNDRQGKTPLDVIELLAGIVDDAHFEAQATGRDLDWQESAEYVIDGRKDLLHRAFENILRNALKFTPPSTTVSVSTQLAADGRLHIRVCDHGPGVLPSELEAIFQPFHRGAGTAVDGFGLGLAIARRAIQAHGGSVVAANRDGGGLCVEIIL
jgi:two-component system OmpR family sensor kinase